MNWTPILDDPTKRAVLEQALEKMLTANITKYLPLSMQFPRKHITIEEWVDELNGSAQVLCAFSRHTSELVGMIMLHHDAQACAVSTCHIGYFLGENYWGQGYASELVVGLVDYFESGPQTWLLAGVESSNGASARVLEKAGFKKIAGQSSDARWFFEYLTSA